MLRNAVLIAIRRMRRHLGYTAINIIGLAVGLAVCACISLYVADELSYDDFHAEADRLYRVVTDIEGQDRVQKVGLAPQPVGPLLQERRAAVERAVRLFNAQEPTVQVGAQYYRDRQFFYAEASFFDVFSFELTRGDPATALEAPGSVVLAEATAETYFGDRDPMGQTIDVEGTTYTVTGIVDGPPRNTHLQFDGLFAWRTLGEDFGQQWGNINAYTYLVLADGTDPQAFARSIADLVQQEVGDRFEQAVGMTPMLALQHVPDIHLRSDRRYDLSASGDIRYVWIFGAVAGLVLLIACINFMNLATARSMERAREVGVRKTTGATRLGLAGQFLAESIVTVLGAAVLAMGLAAGGLPLLNAVSGKALTLSSLLTPGVIGAALGGVVVVGLVAGSYPAFVLSGFQPARVLQGDARGTTGDRWLRQGLVVVQFVVAVALLIGVGVILRQFSYMQAQNLGFQGERVLVADLRALPDSVVAQRSATVKQELSAHRSIEQAALTSGVPGRPIDDGLLVSADGLPSGETRNLRRYSIDPDYLETLSIDVVAGRDFRPEDADIRDPAPVLVNETAVDVLGWASPQDALGKTIQRPTSEGPYRVVGVVTDYHHFSLRQQIEPVYIRLAPSAYNYAALRVAPGQTDAAVDYLRQTWNRLYPAYPSTYFFLDEDFDRQYRAEQRLATIFGGFAGLALLVACLGLLGLAAFTAQRRMKEISVRKVLGAPVPHLVGLLSVDFLRLVGVAFVLAAPLAYLGAERWLQRFAYAVDLGPWLFAGAGLAVAALALATVSVHTLRAALLDPAHALRQE